MTANGDGLAVRAAPSLDARVASALKVDPSSLSGWRVNDTEVRLDTGNEVAILLGPLCDGEQLDGLCWYRILDTAAIDEDTGWDLDGDGQPDGDSTSEEQLEPFHRTGWVSAGDGKGPYLEFRDIFDTGIARPAAHGRTSLLGEPFVIQSREVIEGSRWALASGGLGCELDVTLSPGGTHVLSARSSGFSEGWAPRFAISPGEYRLDVRAGVPGAPNTACPWAVSIALEPIQG